MIPVLRAHGAVTGIDPAEAAIRYSKQRYDGMVELHRVDFPLEVPSGRDCDLVTLFDVLEHLDDDARLLRRHLARKWDRRSDFRIGNDWVNARLADLFGLERHLLRRCNLPLGVSLLAVALRPPEDRLGRRPE